MGPRSTRRLRGPYAMRPIRVAVSGTVRHNRHRHSWSEQSNKQLTCLESTRVHCLLDLKTEMEVYEALT
jgi:hypothetical protein